jgi:hypothetical protein
MDINLAPLANAAVDLGVTVLSVVGPIAVAYIAVLARKHGILANAQAQQTLADQADTVLAHATSFGASNIKDSIAKAPLLIDVNNPEVAAGVQYVTAQAPALFKQLGYDLTTQSGQAAVAQKLIARK